MKMETKTPKTSKEILEMELNSSEEERKRRGDVYRRWVENAPFTLKEKEIKSAEEFLKGED